MAAVLSIDDLTVSFAQPSARIDAVRQVSLAVQAGECVGIVGESGSGKTQVFMAAMGLLAVNGAARGSVRFGGEAPAVPSFDMVIPLCSGETGTSGVVNNC